MGEIFRQVSAEVSPGFIEQYQSQFDIHGMLKQICDDACVSLEYMNNVYNLKGQWNMIAQAHNMLSSMVAGAHGSRQFSVLVEAAEAISNMSSGVELQEQVQRELMQMEKLKQNPHLTDDYNYMAQIPVSMGRESEMKAQRINENFISRGMPPDTCISDADVLTMNNANTHVTEYDILAEAASLKEIESNMATAESRGETMSGVSPQDSQPVNVIQVYVAPEETDSSEEDEDETEQELSGNMQMVAQHSRGVNEQENVQDRDTMTYAENKSEMQTEDDISQDFKENLEDTDGLEIDLSEEETLNENIKREKEINSVDGFACDQCDFIGKLETALKDHIQWKHAAEKAAKCDICQKVFSNSRYLKRHQACHGEPQYKCTECGKEYKVMKALKDHLKKHSDSYIKPEFKCHECPKVFCSNYVLECHVKSEHKGIKKSFLCQTCGKSFTTKHTLQQHANVHVGARPYKCNDCGKSFSYESALRDHKFIHDGTKQFECPHCKKAFRQRSALKAHEKIHKALKDFTCDECGRGFTQKQALQRHIRAHKGLKPFSCKLCKRNFGDAAIIRRHMKLVHKIIKDIPDWREDIVSSVPQNKDYFVKSSENDNGMEQEQSSQMNAQSSFGSHPEVTTRLPPVTTIQGFRHLDAYPDHELPLSHSLSVSQEQLPPMNSQFSMTMPAHHEYMLNQSTTVTQYSYTVASTELPPSTEAKSLEPPPPDNSKVIHMTPDEVPRLEMDKAEHIQYLDENLDQRWRKYLSELHSRSAQDVPETAPAVQTLQDQQKVCNTVDTEAVEAKDNASVKTLEADVHEPFLYSFYNTSLPGGHYSLNLGHFTTGALQPSDTSGDTQVQ